jgi:hypothetical protein
MAEGFKNWTAGDVLAAADVNDFLMRQAVMRFANASGRNTDLTGVLAEGMVVFLKDDDQLYVYDGTQWRLATSVSKLTSTTANLTLGLTQLGTVLEVDSASNRTVTIPADATTNFPVGSRIDILRVNTGEVDVAPAAGVTLNSISSRRKLSARWSAGTVIKRAANSWALIGDLKA